MDFNAAIEHILQRMEQELPNTLKYHSVDHTRRVMDSAKEIALSEAVPDEDLKLLMTAAAYHDCGFLLSYEDHEKRSCEIAGMALPDFGFKEAEIDLIQKMIMSTKVPQASETLMGRILCDADLDYLGCEDYDSVANGLLEELKANGFEIDSKKWFDIQIGFLQEHQFWTETSIQKHGKTKEELLQRLLQERASIL